MQISFFLKSGQTLLLLCLTVSVGWGQSLPELKTQLAALGKTYRDDSLRVELLMNMARAYASISLDSTEQCANEALKISKKIGYVPGQARAIMGRANVALSRGKREDAQQGYEEALRLFVQSKSLLGQARCLSNIGNIAGLQNNSQEAITYFLQAMEIHKRIDTTSIDLCITYMNLGEQYLLDSLRLQAAEEALQRATNIADQQEYTHLRVAAYLDLGRCYKLQSKPVEALGISLKALQLAREHNDEHGIAQAYTNLSDIYIDKKEYEKALQYITDAENIFEKVDDQLALVTLYKKHGFVLMELQKYAESLEIYKKQLVLSRRMELAEDIHAVYLNLAKASRALGEADKAAQYEAKARELGLPAPAKE